MRRVNSSVERRTPGKPRISSKESVSDITSVKTTDSVSSLKSEDFAGTFKKMDQLKVSNRPTEEESGDLSPILIGDYIVLQDLTLQAPGFVCGDPAFQRCGVQKLPGNLRAPSQYDDYVFQIFPALIYRSRMEELTRAKTRTSRARTSSSLMRQRSNSVTSVEMNERDNEEKLLHERIEHEDRLNESTMKQVRTGIRKEALRYGQVIQLLHVKSNLFITCHHSAALKDASCRKVSLREGALSAQFQVSPCFKAQTEGSVVFSTHSIKLASVRLNGNMFLHTSEKVYEDVFREESKTLPCCLRIQQTMELNASSKFTTFVIRKCSSFKKGIHDCLQSSFSPFRLYHSQAESFIVASSSKDKNYRNKNRKAKFKSSEGADNFLALPPHIAYLRETSQHSAGEDPDPTDPRNHTSKSVWVLEPAKMHPLNRNSSGAIGWGEPVRIRHLPSGRYLCVDTSAPFHSLPPSERWFRTYLVVEPTDDPVLRQDSANYCSPESAVFRMECEGTASDQIPKNVSSCRVDFKLESRGSSLNLYLHNADVPKPRVGSTTYTSRMLVFSTMRSAQDALKIMPVSREETQLMFRAKAFIPVVMAYAERVADAKLGDIPSSEKLVDTMNALLNIISFQGKAGGKELQGVDWIKKANSMLPSAFSALFEGETSEISQRICRDLKLLDAVFAVSLAPYQRFPNPFNAKEKEAMAGCAGIQKLVHVALQRMFVKNTTSQLYFRRTLPPVRPLLRGNEETQSSWMELLKLQLEDPLGSAVSLSKLLSANGTLLRTYATPSMVQEFARMIRELGPQPRLVNFFESICAIDDLPVKANQEMILRICWRLPEDRTKLFVEMVSMRIKAEEYGDLSRSPGGDYTGGKGIPPKQDTPPAAYYGKDDFTDDPVFVHWAGHDRWSQGMDNYLFFGPTAMTGDGGLEVKQRKGQALVRIEEFCWVAEPERLCEAVTGVKWSAFETMKDTDDDVARRFSRQEQLVQYFIAEMDMLAKLCFGRSYNAITLLQVDFPYCTLIAVIKNIHLPCLVRAAVLNLLRVIYVDRFPQMMNCARPSIPEVLWVYDASDMPKEDVSATPVIQPINLKTGKNVKFAFPSFQISRTHKFYEHPDPLMSFPDDNKFFLLASALNDIMRSFGSGRIDHSNRSMNTLATATVKTLSDLLSFGFLSSYDKMKVLVKSLARLLDGRRDVQYVIFDEGCYEPFEEGFFPLKQRFDLSTNSVSVTSVKKVALDVMLAVSDFRCQFRLGKLLEIFKEYTEEKKQLKELKVFHGFMAKFEEKSYDGFLTAQLFVQFEELFTSGDGKLLDFEEMSRQPLMTILLDCLMYKDDVLHSKALELLERTYAQRAQLIKAVKDVILLERAPHYPQLNSDINYFVLLLRSTEVWAVSSKISGPFDPKKESDFHDMCETIDLYLYVKIAAKYAHRKSMIDSLIGAGQGMGKNIQLSFGAPPKSTLKGTPKRKSGLANEKMYEEDEEMKKKKAPIMAHQDMLRAMNLQFALTMALTIDYNLAFKGSICSPQDKIKSRDIHIQLLRKVVMLITDFVKHNVKNQDVIYEKALPFLRDHLGDLKLPPLDSDFPTDSKTRNMLVTQPGLNTEEVIIECLRGNGRLCEEMPVSLLDEFGSLLNSQIDMSESPLLEFFHITIRPDPTLNPLFRNQEATLDQLISSKYPNTSACVFGCFNIHGQPTPEKPQAIIDLLSKCIMGDNGLTAARLQGLDITVDATFEVLVEKVSNSIPSWKELDLDDSQPSSPKETKSDRWSREAQLLKDDYFISLVKFLDLQLTSLVVDPRMYQRPDMWRVVSVGVGTLISAFATNLHTCMGGAPAASLVKLCDIILPAIRIVHQFFKGATSMGMDDLLGRFGDRLRGEPKENPNSVFASLLRIRSYLDHNDKGRKKNFPKELIAVEHAISISGRNLQFLLNPDSELEADGSVMAEAQLEMDNDSVEMPAVKRSPSLDRMTVSKVADSDSPEVLLSYFVEAITGNTKINQKLLARKFEFLNVLESVELRTMPKSDLKYDNAMTEHATFGDKLGAGFGGMLEHALDHKGRDNEGGTHGEAEYGVRISWSMVVDRLVAFARAHNFDSNESPLIRVHNVLRNHVLKARSVEATSHVFDSSEMSFDDVEAFREVQNKLDKAEVTEMALLAISTHTPGARDTAAVSAIELLRELLFSGNKNVQSSVLYFIEHVDKDARLLKHVKARLQESAHYIKERCDQVRLVYAPMQREHQLEYEEADQTLKLLTEMLEGHNYAVQNIIRSQPMQAADVDLIKMVFDLLHLQVGQPHLLKRMGEPSINLLTSTLVFIVECLQGPCDGNQEAFAKSETTIAAVKAILQSNFHPRIPKHEVMKVKCRAILIFAACLEGRKDRAVHDILVAHIDPFLLHQFAMEVTEFIKDAAAGTATWSKDIQLKKKVINEALQGLVALANTRTELNLVGSFAAETTEIDAKKGKMAVEKMMRQAVASVEVMWNGRIEFVSFPLPKATAFLSSTTKARFLDTVDLSSHEKRMKELIRAEPNLSAEMQQVYVLAKKSAVYRFIHKHFSTFKMIQYALVVLLNLNVIMTEYGDDKESGKGEKEDLGYDSAYRAAFYGGMNKKYNLSLAFTYILGVPNILGCFLMMAYMGVSNIPIVIRMIDSDSNEKKLLALSGQDVSYRNRGAFTKWGVTLVFNFIFIILHLAAYPGSPQISLYAVLLLGINLPWTFLCLRNYVLVANSAETRLFCIIFDSLVTKPFFRNQILLVFFSVNGFRYSPYFTLMLLDVVNISPTIQSLVKSVTKPAPQLGIVAYLFIIIVVIFASFGLEYFEPYFAYDEMYDDDSDDITGVNPYGCHSVVACAWLIFYKGLPEGRMDQVLDVITNREDQYLARVLFDLAFFIIVGVFLFNIITGLIVDTFGSLREEAAARADLLNNECYVCGFTRTAYDDIGMVSPSFDSHKLRNHYIWNYLYFIQYILAKDQTDFSGVESYVHGMLQSKCQDWLPARTSFAAQNHGMFGGKEDASIEREKRINDKMESSFEAVDKRFKDITGQVDRMGERFGSEMEAFQTHMEQFVVKVLKGSKI